MYIRGRGRSGDRKLSFLSPTKSHLVDKSLNNLRIIPSCLSLYSPPVSVTEKISVSPPLQSSGKGFTTERWSLESCTLVHMAVTDLKFLSLFVAK